VPQTKATLITHPFDMVVFGGWGDLAKRKLLPAPSAGSARCSRDSAPPLPAERYGKSGFRGGVPHLRCPERRLAARPRVDCRFAAKIRWPLD